LLRGADLAAAEAWLSASADKDPGPTALESGYLVAARGAATRRLRSLMAFSLLVAVLSLGLLVFALISRSEALHARNVAKAQALTADAERVGAQAVVEKNVDVAMLHAVLAVKLQDRPETEGDLLATLQKYHYAIRLIRLSHNAITALAVAPSRELLANGDSAGIVRFEDMSRWRQDGQAVSLKGAVSPRAIAFSTADAVPIPSSACAAAA
jgi:hypothetical protein